MKGRFKRMYAVLIRLNMINRRSYTSTHVLLDLYLTSCGKSNKMRCLSRILLLFRNKFNKFNNKRMEILCLFVCLFVCFVALLPKSTAMVMAGGSVHLTTLFPGQA